jgi:hypothetical protein
MQIKLEPETLRMIERRLSVLAHPQDVGLHHQRDVGRDAAEQRGGAATGPSSAQKRSSSRSARDLARSR